MTGACLACCKPLIRGTNRRDGVRGLCRPCYLRYLRGTLAGEYPRLIRLRSDVVQDVQELLAAGEGPERAAQRMGMTTGAIGRALHRAGHTDLALPFWRVQRRARRAAQQLHCDQPEAS
jgi:hypothetical protein